MRLVFIQDIIDRIRGKIFALPSVVKKYECFLRAKDFHTLGLGSSHMEHSFVPSKGEINMGSASQDLYYSYNLYKLLNNDNLKRIFITFSVFSPGDFLIKSSLNKICIMFKLLYNIPYQDEKYAKKSRLKNWEKFYNKRITEYRKSVDLPDDYNGTLSSYTVTKLPYKDKKEIEQRALSHYKINRKPTKNMEYCIKLLEETQKNSQEIYFILPPALDIYKAPLPSSDVIFEELYKVCKDYPHAKIINLYDSKDFLEDDFADGDHLNGNGCIKFTKMLKEIVEKQSKCGDK